MKARERVIGFVLEGRTNARGT